MGEDAAGTARQGGKPCPAPCTAHNAKSAMNPIARGVHASEAQKSVCFQQGGRTWVSRGMQGPSMLMRNCMREARTESASHTGAPLTAGATRYAYDGRHSKSPWHACMRTLLSTANPPQVIGEDTSPLLKVMCGTSSHSDCMSTCADPCSCTGSDNICCII